MSAKNIINVLKTRITKFKETKELYELQNDSHRHYIIYRKAHMVLLVKNAILNKLDPNPKNKYFDPRFQGVVVPSNIDTIIGNVYSSYMTTGNIVKAYSAHGFKQGRSGKGKRYYFAKGFAKGDNIKIYFPTPESRQMKKMSTAQKRQPLPTIYDNVVSKKGPNNDLIADLIQKSLIAVFNLKSTKRGRGESVTLPDGSSIGASKLKPGTTGNARKLHGGDSTKAGLFGDPNIGNVNPEATSARLVDAVEELKKISKEETENLAADELAKSKFDLGFDHILNELDIYFEINTNSISDIVKNNKTVEIGITIGDVSMQKLMKKADRPGLLALYNKIEKELSHYLKDPAAIASKSMKDLNTERGAQAIIKGIFGPLTQKGTPDMRFKANKALMNKKGRKKQTTAQFKQSFAKTVQSTMISKATATKKQSKTKRYNRNTTNSTTSLASLMQIVNAELPRFLKRNMTPPRLQYRGQGNPSRPFAGPFNTGVEVTSLTDSKSNAGGLNVNYTYEKYPYQTFEPGFKQGSTLRDPRELIKESIRQIMIQNKQNRFLRFRRH